MVTFGVAIILSFFFLKDGSKLLPSIRGLVGQNVGWHLSEVLTRTWNTLGGYIRAQAAVSAIDAVIIGLGLWILKVPMALALAVITFFAGFIPIVGAVSAGALAVLIALVDGESRPPSSSSSSSSWCSSWKETSCRRSSSPRR